MDTIAQDLRYAVRTLAKSPGFAVVVTLTLALGIGGNATIFTALQASLLADLPYPHADRLVGLDMRITGTDGRTEVFPEWSYPKFETMRAGVTTMELVAARTGREVTMVGGAEPARAYLEAV